MAQQFIIVEPESALPPYAQIFEQLRSAIQRGSLKPGHSLPTVRQLAGDLAVAPNTVARAYQDLQQEGWLVSDGRRGTRVADVSPLRDRGSRLNSLKIAARNFAALNSSLGFSRREIVAAVERALGD